MTGPPNPSGLIDFFLHPPLGIMSPWLDGFGPYDGNNTITFFSTTPFPSYTPHPIGDSFGVLLQLNGALPLEWGFDRGWSSEDGQYDEATYIPPLGQLVVQHRFLSGAYVTTQRVAIESFPLAVMWQVSIPTRVGLLCAPGISLDLYFLRTGSPS